ncbi:PRTRC system protein B, partial [Flavobacterium petrolei]
EQQLYFVNGLGMPNGKASVPSMLWYASKNSLAVFALTTDRRPTENTPLYFAPFFNIYEDGKVCMGTVSIDIKNSASVEEFTDAWEDYFFNSYFSHLLGKQNPIKGNCVSLWKKLIETGEAFPKDVLKKNNKTLKNLL